MSVTCCGMTVKRFRIRCSSACDDGEDTVSKMVTTNNEGGVSLMVRYVKSDMFCVLNCVI
jgi:hypothetical protein